MDIKGKIDEIVGKIKSDADIKKKFMSDPVSAVKGLLGVELANDQIEKIVDGIKAKISFEDVGSKLGGLFKRK